VASIWTLPGLAHSVVWVPVYPLPSPALVHEGRFESSPGSADAIGASSIAAAAPTDAINGAKYRVVVGIGNVPLLLV
jgi:hypothetical protein